MFLITMYMFLCNFVIYYYFCEYTQRTLYLKFSFLLSCSIDFYRFFSIRKKITNRFIRSFLYYIPYSVLAVMAVPAIFHATGFVISGIAACIAAAVLAYSGRGLITVASGAALTALILELVIPLVIL